MDREKVIKGLEAHEKGCGYRSHHCDTMDCPYRYGDESCDIEEMCHDALALIDTQYKLILELQNLISIGTKMMNSGEAEMKQEEDYSVTWSEVIGIVDKLIERDEPMSMGEIESAVRKAWKIIFDDRCKKYGVKFEQEWR